MANLAFSYLRFSTPDQASGDSHRRQLAMAEKYAAEHHLALDRHLSFRDLGVSAYRGQNAKEGALRAFLEAIEHDLVPRGSFLLIESLDRLSRDRIVAAQTLFMQIVQAGITIVTLVDQRSFSLDGLNRNPLDLIISLVSMMRANEESEMKSQRIRAAFDTKRANLATRPWSARCPGWLRLDKSSGSFIVVEERANVLRRIYRDALAGVSHQTIARTLNEERVPLFGHGNQKGKIWQTSLIKHLLRTPTAIGRFVPFTSEYVDGVRSVRPLPAVENYYPALIDTTDWEQLQAKRIAWGKHYGISGAKTGRANLLAGLSRCPFCDRTMVLLGGCGNPNWRYLICRHAYSGVGCSDRWVRYSGIEEALTVDIREVIRTCPRPALTSEVRAYRLMQIRGRLHTLRKRQTSLRSDHATLRQSLRPIVAAEAVSREIETLLVERRRLRIDRPKWRDVILEKKLEDLRAAGKAAVVDRKQLHAILRSLLTKVVVDWPHDQLIFHWRHGGESAVLVATWPQRKVENPRRANRPRYRPGENAPALPIVAR
jgi:DNA invertase Pin-like site-specific DNA recombinase